VVWTECILGLTFIASGVAAVACLLADIEGGLGAVLRQPDLASKLRIFFLGVEGQGLSGTWTEFFASTQPLAIGLAGGFVLTLATHGTDQDIVQRVLTCKDSRSGGKSLLGSAVLVLPLAALFLLVGSLLYFLHQLHPEAVPAAALKPDEQFPRYIVERVPAGLAGFIFAGIFAATLSSLASVLNALASTLIADFYRPYFRRQADETHYLRASRAATLLAGAAVALTAWAFIGSGESILDLALQVLTYFYGGILGVFLLGIFTQRGSPVFAVAGMMAGVAVVLLLQLRAFIDQPSKAPKAVADLIGRIPDAAADLIARCVPLLAWPLWIVAGSAVAFAIGAAGRQTIVRR
jgi:Na+/proline symporter